MVNFTLYGFYQNKKQLNLRRMITGAGQGEATSRQGDGEDDCECKHKS